jgi:multiple sugar transport system permease protein
MTNSLSTRKRIFNALSYLALILLALFFLFPLVFMFMSAFKNDESQLMRDMSGVGAFFPNSSMGTQNFTDVFSRFDSSRGTQDFWRIFFNSSFVVAVVVMFGLVVNSAFAYALARMRFWGRNALIIMVVSLIIIPFQAVSIPLMLITYQHLLVLSVLHRASKGTRGGRHRGRRDPLPHLLEHRAALIGAGLCDGGRIAVPGTVG